MLSAKHTGNQMTWKYILGFLALTAATIWLAVLAFPDPKLHLIACDVGQGDAILASYGTNQVLIDGGPDNRVLDCLADHLPFWDREIELVILTHPQTDHFNGLIEVFRRYHVGAFVATPIDSSTQGYQVLKSTVGGSGIKVINPTRGMEMVRSRVRPRSLPENVTAMMTRRAGEVKQKLRQIGAPPSRHALPLLTRVVTSS